MAFGLTANGKPEWHGVHGQVEELTTKTTEGAAIEVKECVDSIDVNMNLAILQIKFAFKYINLNLNVGL